jgi:hypothetical protein
MLGLIEKPKVIGRKTENRNTHLKIEIQENTECLLKF